MAAEHDGGIIENVGTVRLAGGESLVSRRSVFSKDSKILFCCCGRRIRVYSTLTGDLLRELKGHQGKVTGAHPNPRNHLQLLSCSLDGTVIVWDYADGIVLKKYRLPGGLAGLILHPAHEDSIFLIKEIKKEKTTGFILGVFNTKSEMGNKQHMKTILEVSGGMKQCAMSGRGDYLACTRGDTLCLWHFRSEKMRKFSYKRATLTCVAFHPQEMCVATGDSSGRIVLWQGLDHPGDPVRVELHWHAHSVADLAFTIDGSYILSGGEESVLVLWQFKTHHKQFLPRLGAPIKHICTSTDDTLIAVSHVDNAIRLVSGVEIKVKHTIQGLRHGTRDTRRFGLVFDPRSKAMITNNMPGVLQFYMPQMDHHVYTLDVLGQNYISRTGKEKSMFYTQIEHVAFSDNGLWMATVERRDNKQTTPELRLKFWEYETTSQRYTLNTCVDPPHEKRVVSAHFQPQSKSGLHRQPLAMTASADGRFKLWALQERKAVGGRNQAWGCHSVGYYGEEASQDAAFAEDGSLLAVAYEQEITLWEPETNELKKTLSLPFPNEKIRKVLFGHGSSSQFLIVSTQKFLIVWNLLTCSVWWSIEARVSELVADPHGPYMAAFALFNNSKTHLYIFDPSTPKPVAVQANVLKKVRVTSAGFDPNASIAISSNGRTLQMSKLYFLTQKQELFTVDEENGKAMREEQEGNAATTGPSRETEEQQSAFLNIFGHSVRTEEQATKTTGNKSVRGTPSSVTVRQMLSTPAHVLPPVTSLCSAFLQSLLVSRRQPSLSSEKRKKDSQNSDSEDEMMKTDDSDTDDELGQRETTQSLPQAAQLMDTSPGPPEQEPDDESLEPGDFSWLRGYFKN